MAGDWIKMRNDLGDDPAVVLIAAAIDRTEDEVVGKLHRLWSWADKHTTDGTAPAITAKWVDRYVSVSGFASAMESAGWLEFTAGGVCFPEFDRHNGASAKSRAEATIRKRLSRENRDQGETGVPRTGIPRPFVRHVFVRDAYTCVFCGTASDEATEASRKAVLSVDHLVPTTRGGSGAVENLACACRACNTEKADRTPEEWGMLPTFLQADVSYVDAKLVSKPSRKKRDTPRTEAGPEKRREEKKRNTPKAPKGAVSAFPSGFESFWSAYPRKVGKDSAARAYAKRRFTAEQSATVLDALQAQLRWPGFQREERYIPHASTWLNEGRWQDEPPAKDDGEAPWANAI